MNIRTEPAFVRRRRIAAAAALVLVVLSTAFACHRATDDDAAPAAGNAAANAAQTPSASATPTPTASSTPTESPTPPESPTPKTGDDQPVALPPADTTDFTRKARLTGHMSPKSVVAGPDGILTAQNMMYTHTISVFDPPGKLIKTIPDSVDLSDFGIQGHPGT
jgi:hypothetical protein